MMNIQFCLLVVIFASSLGAQIQPQSHIIPEETESVNGSRVDGGCEVNITHNFCGVGNKSFLIDGINPVFNTTDPNWASELVTMRKNRHRYYIPYDHVFLQFLFQPPVSLTSIRLSLFNCPQWGIGAPNITVYARENNVLTDFNAKDRGIIRLAHSEDVLSSCNDLVLKNISLKKHTQYKNLYIVVSFEPQSPIDWVYIGEVQFFGALPQPSPPKIAEPGTTTTSAATPIQSHTSFPEATNTASSLNAAIIATGVAFPIVALIIISSIIIVIFLLKRHKKLQQNFRVGNLQNEYSTKSQEEYEFQDTNYDSILGNESIKDLKPCYAEVGESTLMREENTNNGNAIYEDIGIQVVKKLSSPPTPNHSPPKTPTYSEPKKLPPNVQPNPSQHSANLRADKTPEGTDLLVYSTVKKDKAPDIPRKSAALEEYLTASVVLGQSDTSQIDGHMLPAMHQNTQKLASLTRPKMNMEVNPNYYNADLLPTSSSNDKDSSIYSELDFSNDLPLTSISNKVKYEIIYSEPINPSDFMEQCTEEATQSILQIYAPVYTDPSTPQEGRQPPLQVSHDNILEREVLGSGQFGQVILASTQGLSLKDLKMSNSDGDYRTSFLVAVKKLISNAHEDQRETFDKEVRFMSQISHSNIVRMLGVCSSEPAFIMMEYMDEGDLNQFLQRYSEIVSSSPVSSETQISTSTLIYMATQIASAMKYLASLNFVHRDLATRNCLVGNDFVVKLADFGLSRNLYQSNYYRVQGHAILPIRWMASECYYGKFSEKTDVWSFGVTVWELFTLANQQPYSEMTNDELIRDAIKGYKRQILSKPNESPESVYQIMMQCWSVQPEQRPAFSKLHDQLFLIAI